MVRISEPQTVIDYIRLLETHNTPNEKLSNEINRFLEYKARKSGIPLTGSFELTPFCNLDCKMCYVHLQKTAQNEGCLLSVKEWQSIFLQARKAGMIRASLTGGECLTYPGFDDVYLSLFNLGIAPCILSNGILIGKKRLEFFKQYPPRMIKVTLYGYSEDTYENVTGHRVFHTVYENLLRIRDANIPLKISITPNEYMEKDILPFLNFVESTQIPYDINSHLITPRPNTGREVNDLTIEQYIDIYKALSEVRHFDLAPVDLSELPDEGGLGEKKNGLVCGGGRSSFGIKHNGEMCPCLSLSAVTSKPLEVGFQTAWQQVFQYANTYPFPVECNGCVYSDRCLHCAAAHNTAENNGHCNPRICERTKKLIAAGFIPSPEKGDSV